MIKIINNEHGLTLMEVLAVCFLMGVVFAGVATLYVSHMRQYAVIEQEALTSDPRASIEAVARLVSVANEFQTRTGNGASPSICGTDCDALWIRVDGVVDASYNFVPNNPPTPYVYTDDNWVKYRIMTTPDALRWIRVASNADGSPPGGNLLDTDSALILNTERSGSPHAQFSSEPNNDATLDRVVGIRMVTRTVAGTRQNNYTEVALRSKTNG